MPTRNKASEKPRVPDVVAPRRLVQRDYATSAEQLARRLLGCRLVRTLDNGTRLCARIVETEAYVGMHDRASHAYAGRRTERNEPMYAKPGTTYVYFTYGMHHCFNVVCGSAGEPVAVLVRAAEPIEGLDAMHALRAAGRASRSRSKVGPKPIRDDELCKGPACLCEAFNLDRRHSGQDLPTSPLLHIESADVVYEDHEVVRTPRIGVDNAGEWASVELRWLVSSSRSVSGHKRSARYERTANKMQ